MGKNNYINYVKQYQKFFPWLTWPEAMLEASESYKEKKRLKKMCGVCSSPEELIKKKEKKILNYQKPVVKYDDDDYYERPVKPSRPLPRIPRALPPLPKIPQSLPMGFENELTDSSDDDIQYKPLEIIPEIEVSSDEEIYQPTVYEPIVYEPTIYEYDYDRPEKPTRSLPRIPKPLPKRPERIQVYEQSSGAPPPPPPPPPPPIKPQDEKKLTQEEKDEIQRRRDAKKQEQSSGNQKKDLISEMTRAALKQKEKVQRNALERQQFLKDNMARVLKLDVRDRSIIENMVRPISELEDFLQSKGAGFCRRKRRYR